MINLLPPELKTRQKYARLNTGLRRYVIMAVVIGLLLCTVLLSGNVFATMFTREVATQLEEQNQKIAEYKQVEDKARNINGQLKKLSAVLQKTTRYSAVLKDVAANLPKGSRLSSFVLTGNAGEPLTMIVVADNETTALRVQPNLETMDRFSYVDIQEFRDMGSSYEIELALTFASQEAAQR